MEVYGFGGFGPGEAVLQTRYGSMFVRSLNCIVDARILGHAAGYNEIAAAEINRRVRSGRIAAARSRRRKNSSGRGKSRGEEQYDRVLSQRFSAYPAGSKIVLQSVEPYLRDSVPLQRDVEHNSASIRAEWSPNS